MSSPWDVVPPKQNEAYGVLCTRGLCFHAAKDRPMDRLLIPDVTKEQRNEVFLCLPITTESWTIMRKHGDVHKTENGVEYQVRQHAGKGHIIVIIFQDSREREDDLIAACAWLRLIHEIRETIYIVPHQRSTNENIYSLVTRGMGQFQNRVVSLDSYMAISPMWVRGSMNVPDSSV